VDGALPAESDNPPSMTRTCPVVRLLAGLVRYSAIPVMSSTVAMRPAGVAALTGGFNAS